MSDPFANLQVSEEPVPDALRVKLARAISGILDLHRTLLGKGRQAGIRLAQARWRRHVRNDSIWRACWYAVLLSAAAVVLPWASCRVINGIGGDKADWSTTGSATGDLSGLGQIVGGLLAAFVATITFIVQLYGGKNKRNAILTPFALRSAGVYSACGVSLAAVFASAFVPFLDDWGVPVHRTMLVALAWLYCVLALPCVLLLLNAAVDVRRAANPAVLELMPDEVAEAIAHDEDAAESGENTGASRASSTLNDLFVAIALDGLSAVERGTEGLGDLRDIVSQMGEFCKHWAKAAPQRPVSRWSTWSDTQRPKFHGPFAGEWGEVARAVARSNERGIVEIWVAFLCQVRFAAGSSPHLQHESLGLLSYTYRQAAVLAEAPSLIGGTIDRSASSIGAPPMRFREEKHAPPEKIQAYTRDVAFALDLFKIAFERGHEEDALGFVRRLRGRPLSFPRHDGHGDGVGRVDAETYEAVHDYALLACVGWILHVVEDNQVRAKLGHDCLGILKTALPSPERTVGVWEFYHADGPWESSLDFKLGIGHWDFERVSDARHFEPIVKDGGTPWAIDGAIAVCLLTGSAPLSIRFEAAFGESKGTDGWPESPKAEVEKIIKHPALAQAAIDPNRAAQVCEMIDFQKLQVRKRELANLLAVEPTAEIKAGHEACLARSLEDEYAFTRRVSKSGAKAASGPPPVLADLCRAILAADRGLLASADGWNATGDFLAEGLAALNESRALHQCRISCSAVAPCSPLDTTAAIQAAVVQLGQRSDGAYRPNLVLVPDDAPLLAILYGKPGWQAKQEAKQADKVLPDLGGMTVVPWPNRHLDTILVADSTKLFSASNSFAESVSVEYETPPAAEIQKLREQIVAAKSQNDLPRGDALQVKVIGRSASPLAVADVAAAIAIPLDRLAHFAFDPDDKLLHRGGCFMVDTQHCRFGSTVDKCVAGDTWQPCGECKPTTPA